jgi:hypothetical protein
MCLVIKESYDLTAKKTPTPQTMTVPAGSSVVDYETSVVPTIRARRSIMQRLEDERRQAEDAATAKRREQLANSRRMASQKRNRAKRNPSQEEIEQYQEFLATLKSRREAKTKWGSGTPDAYGPNRTDRSSLSAAPYSPRVVERAASPVYDFSDIEQSMLEPDIEMEKETDLFPIQPLFELREWPDFDLFDEHSGSGRKL